MDLNPAYKQWIVFLALLICCYMLPAQHISTFISLPGGTQNSDFHHPPTHAFHYIIEHGDTLSDGTAIKDNFDFTGYVPIGGSSTNGYLSINHELTSGGVTILDVQFDPLIKAWGHNFAQAIDFSVVQGTSRNCSGAVTPWGTVVSCEEMTSSDSNTDGYNDMGWSIEIDPVTKTIVDYPGGIAGADKMWALGNFRHENIAVHSNQRTVYQAEDNIPGHLYKFVADNPGDFSSGDLYVYVGPKNGNGNWVQLNNNTPSEQNTTINQANALNATDFAGGEDVEISPIDGKVYVAVKGENRVYRFTDDLPLSGGIVSNFETYVGNMSYTLQTETGPMVVDWGTGNDNLAFDDLGNLWVLQDGSDDHIWVVDVGHTQSSPKVRIFGRSPAGSEPTGITFSPDFRFLFMSFQHPSSSNNATSQPDAFNRLVTLDKDVAIVIALKENLGNCHESLQLASDHTRDDIYDAAGFIHSTSTILGGNAITYTAGDSVILAPGFEILPGAGLNIVIQSCSVMTP